MFDVQHGMAPVYLTELCERCSDTRLRSSSRGDFCIPRTNLRLSDKAFSIAGSRAWNSSPTSARLTATKSTFCKHLKTHLLELAMDILVYSVLSIDFIRLLVQHQWSSVTSALAMCLFDWLIDWNMNVLWIGTVAYTASQWRHTQWARGFWMMSWPLSWKYDVMSKIWFYQSMHICLRNNPAEFHCDQIQNDRALGFLFETTEP